MGYSSLSMRFLPFLFLLVLSDVHFVPTSYVPVFTGNGISTIYYNCTMQQCANDDWCNYYSDLNGTYCYYGKADAVQNAESTAGYVKIPSSSSCPSIALNQTTVKGLFGKKFPAPCQLSIANVAANFNRSALVSLNSTPWTFNYTSFPYVTSVYKQANFYVVLVQNFQEPQSSMYGCNRTHTTATSCSQAAVSNSSKVTTADVIEGFPFSYWVGQNYMVSCIKQKAFKYYSCVGPPPAG